MQPGDVRPCERHCPKCDKWKHHSRFRSRKRKTPHSTVWEFNPKCRDCEQIERNEKKNADRPKAIIEQRAGRRATELSVSKDFIMINMGYQSLIPVVRAMMTPEGVCTSCGHPFLNERDIQLEHREPPRSSTDWARHHARNIGIFCASCNRTKNDKPYAQWLDEQEEARISNERHRMAPEQEQPQLALF